MAWAAPWPERTWAVEGATGLGYLLAQQLVAAGERVPGIQPKPGARVRLLATGATNKNDPNDARPVAIAALRPAAPRAVAAGNHAAVLKVWSRRHHDLGRARNQVACRLHAVLCELIPGGFAKEITAGQAADALKSIEPSGAVAAARCELAAEFPGDLRRIDAQMRGTKKRLTTAVRASGTTVTEIFGAGPVIAATMIGYVADVARFPSRDRFAACQRHRPHRGVAGEPEDLPAVPAREPPPELRHPHGRGHPDPAPPTATAGPTTTRRSPKARLPRKRSAASSGKSATPSTAASRPTPARPRQRSGLRAREGNRGTTLSPARPAHTPETGSSAKPLPSPGTTIRPPSRTAPAPAECRPEEDPGRLLTQRGFVRRDCASG